MDLISEIAQINEGNHLQAPGISFTKRESECLFLLARGATIKRMAQILGLSPRTVEMHVNNLKHKLGVSYKSDLVQKAIYFAFRVSKQGGDQKIV